MEEAGYGAQLREQEGQKRIIRRMTVTETSERPVSETGSVGSCEGKHLTPDGTVGGGGGAKHLHTGEEGRHDVHSLPYRTCRGFVVRTGR